MQKPFISTPAVQQLLILATCLLVSCGSYYPNDPQAAAEMRGKSLKDADFLMNRAERITTNDEAAAVYQLRAAEIAWNSLDTDGGSVKDINSLGEPQQHALRIITRATEGVAKNFIGDKYKPEKQFTLAGYSYRVNASIAQKPGIYPLARLESAKPAREVKHELCRNWHTETGVGAPCAPKWKRPTDPTMQRFVSKRSYLEPITAVLTFDGPAKGNIRSASITGYDPTYVSHINLGRTAYPLAADFTAPIVAQTADINEVKIAFTGLIHPGVLDSKLMLLEPYDKDRIPVVLVHGLKSHPRMWKDVINDLRADPQLRGHYQFMLFYYPTGWPITYSSMRLREELSALRSAVGPTKKMVLIGHSMGGLLSRMQVITPGRKIWDNQFENYAEKFYGQLPPDHLAKRVLLFKANPDIGREVYICTPQRGSGLADLSITSWFIKILELPTTITSGLIDLPSNLIDHGKLTSVAGLSPSNPLYKSLEQIPILVPHHSIIGDRGKGDTPHSSDGVVPYWSSHLASAQSEVIVPSDHGAFQDPQSVQELRRILLLNAGIKDTNPSQ